MSGGVSHRGPIPGTDGFGKVYLRFTPKKPPKGHRVLGTIVYGILLSTIAMSFAWSRPHLRDAYALPAMRTILGTIDSLKGGRPSVGSAFAAVGSSEESAVYEQGRAHATDRLMQMEIYRRTALGLLSELHGNASVASDRFFRSLNFHQAAKDDFANLNQAEQTLLKSYCKGVNSVIGDASIYRHLPVDFDVLFRFDLFRTVIQPWQPTDTLAVLRLMAYTWSNGWEDQLRQALVAKAAHMDPSDLWFFQDTSSAEFVPSIGGTTVAVSALRTSTGSALLATAPTNMASHQGLWYLNTLQAPGGGLHVSGASVPGIPYVFIGRNTDISWSFAQTQGSAAEVLYVNDGTEQGERALRYETIRVRGAVDVVQVVEDTPVGPVISEELLPIVRGNVENAHLGWSKLALRSDAVQQRLSLSFLRELNSARDFEGFSASVGKLSAATLTFVYADETGNVGSAASGVRQSEDALEVPGWRKLVPAWPAAPPAAPVLNPPSGLIITADSQHSAHRVASLLLTQHESATGITSDVLQSLLLDTHSQSAVQLQKLILDQDLAARDGIDAEIAAAVRSSQDIVRSFDGHLTTTVAAGVLIEAFRVTLVASLLRPLGSLGNFAAGSAAHPVSRLSGVSPRSDVQWLQDALLHPTCSEPENCPGEWWRAKLGNSSVRVASAVQEALEWCTGSFGADPSKWSWGAAHAVQHAHPNPQWFRLLDEVLSRGQVPTSGGLDSLHRADHASFSALLTTDALYNTENTPTTSLRMVVDMSSDCLWAKIPGGQSNRASSYNAHTAQLRRWSSLNPAEAYDQVCWSAPTSAAKEEL